MTQRSYELQFTHQQLTDIIENMLKIPKSHKALHPSQQRSKYANLADWLISAMTSLQKQKQISAKELAQQQQQLIVSSLTEMIQLTRKQCLQKSIVLEMVQEFLISTLNSYWKVFQNASKEISYEYEHNLVRIEKQYISEIKRLQAENEDLKKDKEHRWRNMFMLIKDNRIYRKKNKKLVKSIHYELQKGKLMAEQMISQQFQNEKIKAKLDYLEEQTFNLQNYIEMTTKLVQLQKKIKKYPKRCKKMLKNDLINIECSQIKNLQDKINFFIKAVQETEQIVDQIYDEDVVFSNFHYNISTQTEDNTQDKCVNTPQIKLVSIETQTYIRQHSILAQCDTLDLRVKGSKVQKKEIINRDSKNFMFMSQSLSRLTQPKKQQSLKSRKLSKRGDNIEYFSICEAIKITIYRERISYISAYNTQIFNGLEIAKHIQGDEKIQTKPISIPAKGIEFEMQTDPILEQSLVNSLYGGFSRNINRKQSKINLTQAFIIESKRQLAIKLQHCQLSKEVVYCFDPHRHNKGKEQIKMKFNQIFDKQNVAIKQIDSDRYMQGQRESLNLKQKYLKQSPLLSKVVLKKTSKHEQLKRQKMFLQQQKNEFLNFNLDEKKKLQSISVQTQSNTPTKISSKKFELFERDSNSQAYSKSPRSKALESVGTQISQISPSFDLKTAKKDLKIKQFNKSMNSLNTSKLQTPKESRNKSSVVSHQQLKNLQLHRNSKLKQVQHKRTVTQVSDNLIPQQSKLAKISQIFKAKALHRISEDIHQIDYFGQEKRGYMKSRNKDKILMPLPFIVNKEGQFILKEMDFTKSLEKILKNMDMRRNQILNSHHTLKSYLVSYFKCLYGRELYQNFIHFLTNSPQQMNQQLIICFNRLANSKLPEPYLIDMFRTFILMLSKCFMINQSPTSDRIRLDLLTSMVNLYYEEQYSKIFVSKMNKQNIHNFCGWFICLQEELRSQIIRSQLYHFLNQILIQSQDSISYTFIQELAYFIPNQELHFKNLIRSKTLLGNKTAIHRLAFFCLRYNWSKMLSIQHSIQFEYLKILGLFQQEQSIINIKRNMSILLQFKNISRCVNYWLLMKQKYGSHINRHLLMMSELIILQYRMRVDFPISRQLRFINLAYQGTQKKLFHELLEERVEQEVNRNYSLY